MYKELKESIIKWLFENENQWQRTNACIDHFRQYIYDINGNYIIGGENAVSFIEKAEKLIYGNN